MNKNYHFFSLVQIANLSQNGESISDASSHLSDSGSHLRKQELDEFDVESGGKPGDLKVSFEQLKE